MLSHFLPVLSARGALIFTSLFLLESDSQLIFILVHSHHGFQVAAIAPNVIAGSKENYVSPTSFS